MGTIGLKLSSLFHGISIGYYCWSYFVNAFFVNFGFFFVNTQYQKAKVASQQYKILLTFKSTGKIILSTVIGPLWLMPYLQQWWFRSPLPITMPPEGRRTK